MKLVSESINNFLNELLEHPRYKRSKNKNIKWIVAYQQYIYFLSDKVDDEKFAKEIFQFPSGGLEYLNLDKNPAIVIFKADKNELYFKCDEFNLDKSSKYFIDVLKYLQKDYNIVNIVSVGKGNGNIETTESFEINDLITPPTNHKLPKYVYHGTSSEHLRQIMKTGIRPVEKSNYSVKTPGLTFFTTNKDSAIFHANKAYQKTHNGGIPIILQIDTQIFDPNKIGWDYDFYSTYIGLEGDHTLYTNTINKQRNPIKKGILFGIKDRYKGGNFQKFSYEGWIAPKFITGFFYPLTKVDIEWDEYVEKIDFNDYLEAFEYLYDAGYDFDDGSEYSWSAYRDLKDNDFDTEEDEEPEEDEDN